MTAEITSAVSIVMGPFAESCRLRSQSDPTAISFGSVTLTGRRLMQLARSTQRQSCSQCRRSPQDWTRLPRTGALQYDRPHGPFREHWGHLLHLFRRLMKLVLGTAVFSARSGPCPNELLVVPVCSTN